MHATVETEKRATDPVNLLKGAFRQIGDKGLTECLPVILPEI